MHGGRVAGQDQGGRVHLGDDRGAGDHVVGPQGRPVVDRGVHPAALDEDRMGVRTASADRRRVSSVTGETDGRGPVTVARALTSSWSTVSRNENSRSCSASNAAASVVEVRPAPPRSGSRSPARGSGRPPGTPWSAARRGTPCSASARSPRRRARRGSARRSSTSAKRRSTVRADSLRADVVASPSAHSTPGDGGTITGHAPSACPARWRAAGPRRRTRRGRTPAGRSPAAPTPGAGRRACSR